MFHPCHLHLHNFLLILFWLWLIWRSFLGHYPVIQNMQKRPGWVFSGGWNASGKPQRYVEKWKSSKFQTQRSYQVGYFSPYIPWVTHLNTMWYFYHLQWPGTRFERRRVEIDDFPCLRRRSRGCSKPPCVVEAPGPWDAEGERASSQMYGIPWLISYHLYYILYIYLYILCDYICTLTLCIYINCTCTVYKYKYNIYNEWHLHVHPFMR